MAAAILLFFISCSRQEKKYTIGVSQCSEDIWREKQNDELRMACYFHEDVDLRFAVAYDSDARQVQQIDSLVNIGIDLLIVAPNQVATISPAIDRAFDSGIPVVNVLPELLKQLNINYKQFRNEIHLTLSF